MREIILGYLPVAGNFEYSVAVFKYKDNNKALKIALAINMVMFAIYNAVILNVVGAVLNLTVAVTAMLSVLRKGKKHE